MMSNNINIVIAKKILMEKWSHAKILIAKDNGSIQVVSNKRYFLINGIVLIAQNKKIKQEMAFQKVFS